MKREKVIYYIEEYHDDFFPLVGRGISRSEYFKGMLDMLEDLGMLPPANGKRMLPAQAVVDINEWEK